MNKYNPNIHHRRSIRLKGYDYAQAGMYFVTICCEDRKCRFGKIENDKMILNEFGTIAYNEWSKLSERFPNFELDVFQIMPNHMHGIIILTNAVGAGFTSAQKTTTQNVVGAGLAPALVPAQNNNDTIGQPQIVQPQSGQSGQPEPQSGQPQIGQPEPQPGQSQIVQPQSGQTETQSGQPQIVHSQSGQTETQSGQPQIVQSQSGQTETQSGQPQIVQSKSGQTETQSGQTEFVQPKSGQPEPQLGQPQTGQSGQTQIGQPEPQPGQTGQTQTGQPEPQPGQTGQTQTGQSEPQPGQTGQTQTGQSEPQSGQSGQTQTGQSEPQSGQPQGLPLPQTVGVDNGAGVNPAPTNTNANASIADIVGAYKSLSANGCLEIYKSENKMMGKLWQRNYHEHIIRNEQSYQNISEYILNNPAKWKDDKFFI